MITISFKVNLSKLIIKFLQIKNAMAGDRTRIDCLEGNHADHYTTIAYYETFTKSFKTKKNI